MCVDAQSDVEVGVSSDPLDDVRWCRELNGEAHHGVTDVLPHLRVPSARTDSVKVPVQTARFHRDAHAGKKHPTLLGPRLTSISTFGGLSVAMFDEDPSCDLG